ncbi:MAG: DUF177 domain-containing protein [Chloroflexi bacterium]|nr:DUF177 domain-containing protein [Chloroflexota bacterium]
MRFNVAQLLKEHSGETRQHTLRENIENLDPEITPLSTLDGAVVLIRTADGVLATGSLHCSLELACSRCLELFSYPLRFTLEEEFRPTIDLATGAQLPRTEDDEPATRIDAHHELDLTEVLRQDILLALPLHPVCRSGCLGLCPQCGKNLNEGPCDCKPDNIDPRFEKLKELLDKS